MIVKCIVCEADFKNIWNLKRHAMRLHPDKVTEIVPRVYKNTKNFRFTCGFCSRNFNSKNHLNYHLKSHGVTQGNVTLNQQKCPLCDYCDPLKKQLIIHFQEIHNIEIVLESRDFPSRSVFDEWKSILEEENSCKFIKQFSKSLSNGTLTEYICHRSGKFISKGKGLRRLKTQGSNKINGFCPAKIRLVEDDERKCSVRFISKHVGHTNDLSHVTLTADERQVIASKIISNVSFDNIINEIQTSATDDIKRIHLITRKDLHNIKQEYSVNSSSAVKHSQNALGGFDIDTWINQLGQTTDCVLYYKSQQDLDVEHIELKSEDFILIIMNEGQCDILKRYASNCIYIDGISSSNGSNFDLITLMVFDDMLQVFPCAFLITNRMDEEVLKMFFRCIRQRTACLTSRIFLSDASDSFYNAWRQIMGETRYNLYCTWHLDKAWQQNLRVIESKARQESVYKQLKTILIEKDKSTFEKMLGEFYNEMLEDPETLEFALYFDYYMKRCKSWANCYRLTCGIETNLVIKNMHKMLKQTYIKRRPVRRLDKTICSLMNFVKDKLLDSWMAISKGKYFFKLKEIDKQHKQSVQLSTELVVPKGDGWEIPSSNDFFEMHSLQENIDFKSCQCRLVCSDCRVCIHRYVCSCIENSIKWNMCEHIHLVGRLRKDNEPPCEARTDVKKDYHELPVMLHENNSSNELFLEDTSSSLKEDLFIERKRNIKEKLLHIMKTVDNIETPIELYKFDKSLICFERSLEDVNLSH